MNQVDQLNGAALAYIGDAIYEVYVRQHVIASGLTQPNRLHRAATRYVSLCYAVSAGSRDLK